MNTLSDVVAEMRDEATALGGDAMVDLNRYADMIEAATREPAAWMAVADGGKWRQCFSTREQARQYSGELIPLYAAPPAVPGWKLVPVEPTQEMVAAAFDAPVYGHPETATATFDEVYRAMLAAAPEPPVGKDET